MDGRRFDSLARALAGAASRRAAVAGVFSALLPLAGSARPASSGKGDRGPADEACLANGQRCGKKSGKRGKPCRKCCSRYSIRQRNGRRRCACKPDGMASGNAAQCCSGQRTAGVCGAPCGGAGQPCCPGETCARGRTCQDGTCWLPASTCVPGQPPCQQAVTFCDVSGRCATSTAGETFCRGLMYCRGAECARDEDCIEEPGMICVAGCDRNCCARVN